MSDHPKEAERSLKRIFICDDIYLDVFRLLAPAKVGLELALVSHQFDALVDTHFKSRKWTLGKFEILSKKIAKTIYGPIKDTFPYPPRPLPNSIVGFSSVGLSSKNSDAIDFLGRIGRLFESNVSLHLAIYGEWNWTIFATSIWPKLNVSGIIKICFGHQSVFQNFRRFISPTILCDCSNLRMISVGNDFFLQFPPNDIEGSSDGQVLCKWLHTPRADGQPKVLQSLCDDKELPMDALKMTFLNATTSVSFIIHLCVFPAIGPFELVNPLMRVGPFELVNSLTREQLTSRRIDNADYWWLIERSPIDKCAKQWAEWEKEALDDGTNDWKVLTVFH